MPSSGAFSLRPALAAAVAACASARIFAASAFTSAVFSPGFTGAAPGRPWVLLML